MQASYEFTLCPKCDKNIISANFTLHEIRCPGKSRIDFKRISSKVIPNEKSQLPKQNENSSQLSFRFEEDQFGNEFTYQQRKSRQNKYNLNQYNPYNKSHIDKVKCSNCDKQFNQIIYSIHSDNCQPNKNRQMRQSKRRPIQVYSNNSIYKSNIRQNEQQEQVSVPREKQSKLAFSRQQPPKIKKTSSVILENQQQKIKCIRCQQFFKISQTDQHIQQCAQQLDVECQYCNEGYPMQYLQDHIAVCEAKKYLEQCQRQAQSQFYQQQERHSANSGGQQQDVPFDFTGHLGRLGASIFQLFQNMREDQQFDNSSGLTKAQIKKVNKIKYKMPQANVDQCCICFVQFENKESINQLNCKHLYHTDCIGKWLELNSLCPLCKKDVRQK